jgi:hypothetical protein
MPAAGTAFALRRLKSRPHSASLLTARSSNCQPVALTLTPSSRLILTSPQGDFSPLARSGPGSWSAIRDVIGRLCTGTSVCSAARPPARRPDRSGARPDLGRMFTEPPPADEACAGGLTGRAEVRGCAVARGIGGGLIARIAGVCRLAVGAAVLRRGASACPGASTGPSFCPEGGGAWRFRPHRGVLPGPSDRGPYGAVLRSRLPGPVGRRGILERRCNPAGGGRRPAPGARRLRR